MQVDNRMRFIESLIRSALALILAVAATATAAIPEAPHQHEPWQPMPSDDIAEYEPGLVAMMFDAGLADPRGGEYREIELDLPAARNKPVITHGWYFPQGFAVCWDGVVHPVLHAGGWANLWTDVADSPVENWRFGNAEAARNSTLVSAALLMRLGEWEMARRLLLRLPTFGVRIKLLEPNPPEQRRLNQLNWFQVAGASWLNGVWNQAVSAHALGDDQLTVDLAEFLLKAGSAVESSWQSLMPSPVSEGQSPVFILKKVPALLEDSTRRLKGPSRPPLDPTHILAMTPTDQVAALIERMDEVDDLQMREFTSRSVRLCKICWMLEEEGAAAVNALSETRDHDRRLTRSYWVPSDSSPLRVVSVPEVAAEILKSLE